MAAWLWFLSVGGVFFLMLCVAYGAPRKRHGHHHRYHGKYKPNPDARSAASGFESDPIGGMQEPNVARSSVYLGQVYFFDSAEDRDMFEANRHKLVAMDSVPVTSKEQHVRRVQRSEYRHTHHQQPRPGIWG